MTNGREAFLAKALSQRGDCLRSDRSTEYGEWFGRQVHDGGYARGDFCAMGLLWCADQTGQLDVLGGANKAWAWVPSWWAHWTKIGRPTKTAARGRIVFFDFDHSGEPEHVGAVLGVRGGDLSTIEFNTLNGQCAERTRRGGDALGFGDPAWHASAPALPGGGSCWIG